MSGASLPEPQGVLRGLIVPHAGYVYSGPIAGSAYRLLEREKSRFGKVVLLGPSHRLAFFGIALPADEAFLTPLGEVPVDAELREMVLGLDRVEEIEEAHAQEHCLEVQLPFLQVVLGNFSILPLVVGNAPRSLVVAVVRACQNLYPDALMVVSTDLSHYLTYPQAQRRDAVTAEHIVRLDAEIAPDQACGAHPLNGFLHAAHELDWKIELLDLRNSGDTCGDRDRVVGYGSFAAWSRT